MSISKVQGFILGTKVSGTGSSVQAVFTTVPLAGSQLVAVLTSGDAGGAASISSFTDNIGDGVAWTAGTQVGVIAGGGNSNYRIYYKTVGTPSGGNKTVTAAITGTQALSLFISEFSTTGGAWSVTGSQLATNGSASPPDSGTLTTAVANAVLIAVAGASGGTTPVQPTGFSAPATSTNWAFDYVSYQIVSAAGPYSTAWTNNSNNWMAMAIAFGSASSTPAITGVDVSCTNLDGTVNVTATISPAAAGGEVVNYATSDGTATAPAYYVAKSGNVTLTPGQTSLTIPVTINP